MWWGGGVEGGTEEKQLIAVCAYVCSGCSGNSDDGMLRGFARRGVESAVWWSEVCASVTTMDRQSRTCLRPRQNERCCG